MKLEQFVADLHGDGIDLWVDQDKLRYRGNAQVLSADRLSFLRTHKANLITLLRQSADGGDQGADATNTLRDNIPFSLLFFASNEAEYAKNKYQLLMEACRFADDRGFHAVWLPERHFHAFGGLYPNPSILAAALAMITTRIRLRAGSVVLPLHHPVRVAEEWAVVDNLSGGRVDLAFAQGWNARDFVLAPHAYPERLQRLYSDMAVVQKLWRGESIESIDGTGEPITFRIYPQPQQAKLDTWVTCSGGRERFIEAGAIGANVLTALLFQTEEELADKIAAYRQARADHGFAPEDGQVTLMLHTFVGTSVAAVKQTVRAPFIAYLKSSVDLWRHQMGQLNELSDDEREDVLNYAFERYFESAALFGTPRSCVGRVGRLRAAGVNEIACLLDFGVASDVVLANLVNLNLLRQRANALL